MKGSDQALRTRVEVAAQLAEELGLSNRRVLAVAAALRRRIVTVAGERNGRKVQLYGPEAVEALREHVLRDQVRKRRVGEKGAGYWRALAGLRVVGRRLDKLVDELNQSYRTLRANPPAMGATIHTLPDPGFALVAPPVVVWVTPLRRSAWRARLSEAGVEAKGKGQEGAVLALRQELVNVYLALRANPEQDPERWAVLGQLIRERRPRKAKAQTPGADDPEARSAEQVAAAEEREQPSASGGGLHGE